MKHLIYLILISCFTLLSSNVFSQQVKKTPLLYKSAINSVGASSMVAIDGKNDVIQSVGQSSVIGFSDKGSLHIQQGYLTKNLIFRVDNKNEGPIEQVFNFNVYPNPFVRQLNVEFAITTEEDVFVQIYDLNGKLINELNYPPSKNIIVPMETYSAGSYLISVISGKKRLTKNIIKGH